MRNTRRNIYLQSQGFERKEVFNPKNHVMYPFKWFSNFNANVEITDKRGYGKGCIKMPSLVCDHCGCEIDGNVGGYFTAYLLFNSFDDIRVVCCGRLMVPDFFDQQFGYPNPVTFPSHMEGSIDHVLAWDMIGQRNKYRLNAYLGKEVTMNDINEWFHSEGFGDGGFSSRGIYTGWVSYKQWKVVMMDDKTGKPARKWTANDLIKSLNEILGSRVIHKPMPQQLDLFQ